MLLVSNGYSSCDVLRMVTVPCELHLGRPAEAEGPSSTAEVNTLYSHYTKPHTSITKFEGATLGHEAQEAYTAYKGSVHACPQRGPHQSHTTWLEVQELLEAAWKTHEKSSIATLVSHIHGE